MSNIKHGIHSLLKLCAVWVGLILSKKYEIFRMLSYGECIKDIPLTTELYLGE
ncbi:MAG: hypothetical protein HHAS10_05340 [Candidatus Altimarinota bacterium]